MINWYTPPIINQYLSENYKIWLLAMKIDSGIGNVCMEFEIEIYAPETMQSTNGQTEEQTDGQTEIQGESSIPPTNFIRSGV